MFLFINSLSSRFLAFATFIKGVLAIIDKEVFFRKKGRSKFSKISGTTQPILKFFGVLETETKSPETFFDLSDFGRRNPSVHLIEDFVSKFINMKNFEI